MNILLVCRNFLDGGGVTARWSSFVDYLSKRHTIFVVTRTHSNISRHHGVKNEILILRSPLKTRLTTIPFTSIINVVSMVFYMSRLLNRMHINVVIVTIPELEEGIACAITCKRSKKPFIIDVRDLIIEDHVKFVYSMFPKPCQKIILQFLAKCFVWSVNSSNCAVTVTSTLKEYLQSDGIKVPLHLVPNGADTTLFHPVNWEKRFMMKKKMGFENDFVILYAGALSSEYYPVDIIFRAFRLVVQSIPNAKLILCGPKGKETFMRFGKNIHYRGLLKRKELARIMRVCDIGVISMSEGRSTFCALTTKVFEYLSSGLPVIAACPKGGELDMLISSNHVGYAVASGDYKSMAEKIIKLLSCEKERQFLAQNGVKLVSRKFNRSRLAETFEEILHSVVSKR